MKRFPHRLSTVSHKNIYVQSRKSEFIDILTGTFSGTAALRRLRRDKRVPHSRNQPSCPSFRQSFSLELPPSQTPVHYSCHSDRTWCPHSCFPRSPAYPQLRRAAPDRKVLRHPEGPGCPPLRTIRQARRYSFLSSLPGPCLFLGGMLCSYRQR